MIFEDPSQKRWKIISLTASLTFILVAVWVDSIIVNPPLEILL
ncbi:MAG: hypothetical protein AAB653_00440 [Patescibacteria group bacterium]